MKATPLKIQWVRHGEVASHHGDVPVTDEGLAHAEAIGRLLGEELDPEEEVRFLYAPTRRARETAATIRDGAEASLEGGGHKQKRLRFPAEEWSVRNPDLYVAGIRVEMVSTVEALAAQTRASGLGPEELSEHSFFREFWAAPDRIGFWVDHPDPPGEDYEAVARRLLTFAASLLDLRRDEPWRYVCVTHSPLLRAFLRRYLVGKDPGEPDYLESVHLTFSTDGSPTVRFRDLQGFVNRLTPEALHPAVPRSDT